MKILLVDDEPKILKQVTVLLESQGMEVRSAPNIKAVTALDKRKGYQPDVIILDRILEGVDSLAYLAEIKGSYRNAPILILSAIDTAYEKASALNAGADDYLSKPFSSEELLARLRSLARRQKLFAEESELIIGNLKIQKDQRTVTVEGTGAVDLSNKEFQVFYLFCSHPGRILSKESLLSHVWHSTEEVESKVVEATINNLRRKLEAKGATIQIKNARNAGYWLET